MDETKWIDIGKTGTWIAKNGEEVTFTEDDLDAIAAAYNPEEREAPLVLGHPEDDDPAYGWTTRLRRVGEILQAKFKQVPEALKEAVIKGHYKKISMALFPDKKTLRHIGLLGAAQPAIPGLKPVSFTDGDYEVYEFSAKNTKEEDIMDERIKALEERLADQKAATEALQSQLDQEKTAKEKVATELAAEQKKQRENEIDSRIDKLVDENRILPADKQAVKEVALSLGEHGTEIELSSGAGKKRLVDHFFDFLAGLPDRKMLTEFSAPADDDGDKIDATDLAKHV